MYHFTNFWCSQESQKIPRHWRDHPRQDGGGEGQGTSGEERGDAAVLLLHLPGRPLVMKWGVFSHQLFSGFRGGWLWKIMRMSFINSIVDWLWNGVLYYLLYWGIMITDSRNMMQRTCILGDGIRVSLTAQAKKTYLEMQDDLAGWCRMM